jgi:hypothetical protein
LEDFPSSLRHQHLPDAIIFHNLLALSHIYENISIESLSKRLGIDYDSTLLALETMVSEQRLSSIIDQVTERIYFNHNSQAEEFSQNIEQFCNALN